MMPVPAGRGAQDDPARAVAAVDVVMQRAAFAQRHAHDAALGGLGRLADRFRHFPRLTVAEADAALLVADDDERGEAEPAAALHDFRHAVDVDEAVDKLALPLLVFVVAAAAAFFTRHCFLSVAKIAERRPKPAPPASLSSELEAALARPLGQRLDATVIHVASPVEDDLQDPGLLRPLGDLLADDVRGLDRRASF